MESGEKKKAEERKIEKQRKRDVSWRLYSQPKSRSTTHCFLGRKLGIATQEYIMLYKISIFFDESQIYVICQN